MTSTLLQGLRNPPVADILGGFRRGQERADVTRTKELAGQILGQTFGGKLGALGKINPQMAVTLAQGLNIPSDEKGRTEALIGTYQIATALGNGQPDVTAGAQAAAQVMTEHRDRIKTLNPEADTSILDQQIEFLQAEPESGMEALNKITDSLVEQGLLKKPGTGAEKSVAELRKETRADLRKQVTDVSKQASAVQTNFKKIQGLTGEISKGNRSAAAQSLIALVKLGEPDSTVREGEMLAALNTQNPVAAIAQLLKGEGSSEEIINAVTAAVDPLNPNIIKVDDLLATANALVSANVPVIQSKFAEAREQGETNLTQRGLKSIFTKRLTERVSKLSDLAQAGPSTEISAAQIQELKAARPDLTEEQIRAALR